MARRAAESIIKIEVAKSGFNVVPPEQAYDSAAQPDAFGVAGRASDHALGFGIFVELVELVLAGGRGGLIGRLAVRGLGERRGTKWRHRGGKNPDRRKYCAGDAQHSIGHWFNLVGPRWPVAGTSPGHQIMPPLRRAVAGVASGNTTQLL